MKKAIGIVLCVLLVLSLSACGGGSQSQPSASAEAAEGSAAEEEISTAETEPEASASQDGTLSINGYTANEHYILDAFDKNAYVRVANVKQPANLKGKVSASSQRQEFPEKFDLRAVDTDGDGKKENYVTSIKYQNPFGTCWAFGAISAAETSILYELGQDAVATDENGNKKDSLDLSEHQTAWFAYTPMPEGDSQEGEGLISMVEGVKQNPSLRLNSGSTQFAASTLFASGCGPLLEPDFETAEGVERQLNYHGKDEKTVYSEAKKNYNYSLEDDWSVDESQRFRQSYMLDDVYFLPASVSFDENGTFDIDHADAVIKAYKEQLVNGRSLSISFCADNYRPGKESAAPSFINTDTWAHYCYTNANSNHVVAIVGWDDTYPKENFLSEVQLVDENKNPVYNADGTPRMKKVSQPPKNGAWIVKNSWGSCDSFGQGLNQNNWGFENTGYFYLSYYDQSLDTATCFDFDVNNELKADLGQYIIDENDFMPCELPGSIQTDFPVSTANAFVAEENQTIKAVSCITTEAAENVEFSVYLLDSEGDSIKSAECVANFSKTFDYVGLHLTRLDKPVSIEKGQRYAVAVRQKCDSGYLISVGCEYNEKAFKAKMPSDTYAANGVVNPGESFIYLEEDDEWWDFSEIKNIIESDTEGPGSYLTYDNFPIKVYASIDA